DEAELRELQTFLDEGLRADEHVYSSFGNLTVCGGASAALHRSGEQSHDWLAAQHALERGVRGLEQARQRRIVLFGEDFSWRHECALVVIGHRVYQGQRGDCCLARTHLALKQA